MIILGIETSCDETSVAIVENAVTVKSNVIASSRGSFAGLAGVIPEQAARAQIECMIPVVQQALASPQVTMNNIDAIAVTRGPGLLGSLLVGTVTARALSSVHHLPVIGVHHTLGHLSSPWLDIEDEPHFPVLTLSASGGHTDLWYRTSHVRGTLLGRTRDDAAGEAFDKGASMLSLPYPGGPSISKAAASGDALRFAFPRPLHGDDSLDFSFSGLKTALKYLLRDLAAQGQSPDSLVADIAASFESAICRHLAEGVSKALALYPDVKEVHIVGGVSANMRLRSVMTEVCSAAATPVTLRLPKTLAYCTDNAAMIAAAGEFLHREEGDKAFMPFKTAASLPLEETVTG